MRTLQLVMVQVMAKHKIQKHHQHSVGLTYPQPTSTPDTPGSTPRHRFCCHAQEDGVQLLVFLTHDPWGCTTDVEL